MKSLAERASAYALREWYFGEAPASSRHPTWQSPLVAGFATARKKAREARIDKAGVLWLTNYDLRFADQLWISDGELGLTWGFKRNHTPGDQPISRGPIEFIRLPKAKKLRNYPLWWLETNDQEFASLFDDVEE